MIGIGKHLMRILYVEDDQTDVKLASRELDKSGLGFEVDVAGSCEEALTKIGQTPDYDLVLIDIRLPDGDGISVLSEIRRRQLPVSVAVLTAYGDEQVAVSALKAGADEYIVKSGKHYRQLPHILKNTIEKRAQTSSEPAVGFTFLFATQDNSAAKLVGTYVREKMRHIRMETVASAKDLSSLISGDKIPFDVLLIDYGLRGMDMPELLRELRTRRGLDIPVVFIADHGDQETAALLMKLGADDYVVKSNSYELRLPSVLESALQKTRAMREKKALVESGERYRMLSGLISDYAYVLEVLEDGRLRGEWLSETFEKIFGYTRTDIGNRGGLQSLVFESDAHVVSEHLRKVKSGEFDIAEFRLVTRSGELRWLRDSAKPVRDPVAKRVVKIYGAAQDMTEQKRTDDEIRRSETRFKELADLLPQPVFEIDRARKISFANRACRDVFGISAQKYKGKFSPLDFISPMERAKVAGEIERVFRGETVEPERYRAVDKDGNTFPVLISASPIVHDDRVVGLRGVLVDLTELAAANEAVAASENRYRFLFESSADAFFLIDESGKFLQVNEAGCEKLGYKRSEIIGQPVEKILPPEIVVSAKNRAKQVLLDKDVTFESIHLRKDGARIPVEVRSRAVSFDGKTVILSSARDLTERKKAEEAIEQRSRQLKILSAASVKINSVLDVGEILRTLVVSGVALVGAGAGTVGLLEDGILRFNEYYRSGSFTPIDVRFAPGQGTPGYVVTSKRARIGNDSEHDPLVIRELHRRFGIRNFIDVPILSRTGDVLGTFAIHNARDGRDFTEGDVEMLEGLAASAAVALENAKLLTDVKKAESAIRESEEKFRTLVESSQIGVYIIQDGRFVYVNPSMMRMYGYSEEEFLALSSLYDSVAPEDRPLVLENIRKRIEGEVESVQYDFWAIKKDGRKMRVGVLGSRTTYHGRTAVIGTAEDITERKLSEERLRESEERYRNLFEESIDAIYVTTPAGKILDINTAGVKLFGFNSRSEMLELENVALLYVNPEDRKKSRHILDTDGIMRDFEITVKRIDGVHLTVQDSATVLRDVEGNPVAYRGILRDVTEERKLEEQLLQSQKLESLGQLTSGIAHDFNNVLGGIIGFTELALGKIEESHPVNSYLMRIYGLADRAAKITKQLLAFARRQILMPKDLDLNELIGDILELLSRLLGEQIQITFLPESDLNTVLADPSQVEQVILNLSVNAGDAMQNGGTLTIETKNVLLDEFYCRTHANVKPGDYVMVSVADTGVGIAPAVIEHIFEPFFTTKEIGKGTGLGLSVVHGIIRQHGGTINVYSEKGKGTTFKVYFPSIKRPVRRNQDRPVNLKTLSTGTETVLVVEDNEELREFMKMLLSDSGYTVLVAGEGEEGLAVFEQHANDISLVISDVVMPKVNGRELREAVKARSPGKKFLFISGYTDSTVHHGFVLDDKVDFLQKPFTAFEFSEKVREILDRIDS